MFEYDSGYRYSYTYLIIIKESGAEYSQFIIRVFCSFFVCFGLSRCRSPPLFNLNLKKQIEWRKEKWQNAQKEENIRIIHIF